MSAYEKIREGNIAEREAMLSALKADFSDFKKDSGISGPKKAPPKKRKKVKYDSGSDAGGFRRKSARLSAPPEVKDKIGSEVTYINMSEWEIKIEVSHVIVLHEILDYGIIKVSAQNNQPEKVSRSTQSPEEMVEVGYCLFNNIFNY